MFATDVFSFDEIYPHIANCVVQGTRRGHFGGLEDHPIYFVEAHQPCPNGPPAGKWLVKW